MRKPDRTAPEKKRVAGHVSSRGFALLLAFAAYGLLATQANAADVDAGSIAPTLGATVTYVGDATGTGAATESVCQEDINCDTFTLTVSGTNTHGQANSLISKP